MFLFILPGREPKRVDSGTPQFTRSLWDVDWKKSGGPNRSPRSFTLGDEMAGRRLDPNAQDVQTLINVPSLEIRVSNHDLHSISDRFIRCACNSSVELARLRRATRENG